MFTKLPITGKSGISLIEIVLVITVIGLIFLVLSNIPSSLGLISSSNYESTAKQIAQKNIEDLRSRTYDKLANGTTAISDSRLASLPNNTSQIIISDCPSAGSTAICTNGELTKQVTISIGWSQSGKPKSINLTTLISKGGLH